MQLKEFSLISPVVESGIVLKALEIAIPSVVIERAIARHIAMKNKFQSSICPLMDLSCPRLVLLSRRFL